MLSHSGSTSSAAAVKDATGDYNASYVLTKLNTFKLGPKCWAKAASKDQGAVHTASFATRDIVAYAKAMTGDDWDAIESQNNNDRETNKALIEPMIEAFKSRFAITVTVDGDDCDAKQNSLWLRYWGGAIAAVKAYPPATSALKNDPPKAKKVAITVNATAKAKDVSVTVGKDGSTFVITGPRGKEVPAWSDKIEAAFKKVSKKK
ncbi:MAG: hypothetical protein JWP01_3220 [Myxococcales bacterium]|nr:hypothetical protein [Myxococcales bacterium]